MDTSIELPPRLSEGDTVGIVSPSSPPRPGCIEGMVDYWTSRGNPVKVGRHARDVEGGFLAGTARARADDFNEMLRDPDVRVIVPSMGGKGSTQLLPLIDFDALRADPKIVLGHSDGSALLVALTTRCNVTTFHGPNGMDFGRLGVTEFSEQMMNSVITRAEPLGQIPEVSTREVVRRGPAVEGRILGGHLRTLQTLIGTPYEPDWTGAILFVEEIDCEFHDVDASLTHLRLAGVLDQISGLVVGTCVDVRERYWTSSEDLSDVIARACDGSDFPILSGIDLGHTRDKVTVPLGVMARLSPDEGSLEIISAGVS
ncbi:S66 peptidase family protein [Luethyella okanaganae]|uniref:LD-carboxypeptidase n=1 Tax=Luethyella okanaganae TaxID=69372 RepID=A0ABW1VG41_9MICO